jgi:multisubunit Na+/H+ antiporter MnhE subunit
MPRAAAKHDVFVRARTLQAPLRIAPGQRRTYFGPVFPWLALWALSFVLMHLYVGKIAADEALFAALGSALTATASTIVLQKHIAPLRAQWRSVAQIAAVPKYVVIGTWEIIAVLARQIFLRKRAESLFYAVPFDAGGDDDESAFRRALAIAYTTATPNFVIIDIDRERGLLIYHQLQTSAIPELTKKLGARP